MEKVQAKKAIALFTLVCMISGHLFTIENTAAQGDTQEDTALFHYTFEDYEQGDGETPNDLPKDPGMGWSIGPDRKSVNLEKITKQGRTGLRVSRDTPKSYFSVTSNLPKDLITSHNYVVEASYLFETKSNVRVLHPNIDTAGSNASPIMLYSRDDEFLIKTNVSNLKDLRVFVTDDERKRELDKWYDTILVSKEVRNEYGELEGAILSAYVNGKKFVEAFFPGGSANVITDKPQSIGFGVNEYYKDDATGNSFVLTDYKMYTEYNDLKATDKGVMDGDTNVSCESINIAFNNKINSDTLKDITLKDESGNEIPIFAEILKTSENEYDLNTVVVTPYDFLESYSTYTLDISKVQDLLGTVAKSENQIITFTTAEQVKTIKKPANLLFHYTFEDYEPRGEGQTNLLPRVLGTTWSVNPGRSVNPNKDKVNFDKVTRHGRTGIKVSHNTQGQYFSITSNFPNNMATSHNYVIEASYLFETESRMRVLQPIIGTNSDGPAMLYSRDGKFLINTDETMLKDIKVFVTEEELTRELNTWYDTMLISEEVRNEQGELIGANLTAYVNGKKFVEAFFPGNPSNQIADKPQGMVFGINSYYKGDEEGNSFVLTDYKLYTEFNKLKITDDGIMNGATDVSCEGVTIAFNDTINPDTLQNIILKDSEGSIVPIEVTHENVERDAKEITIINIAPKPWYSPYWYNYDLLKPLSTYTLSMYGVRDDELGGTFGSLADAQLAFTTGDEEYNIWKRNFERSLYYDDIDNIEYNVTAFAYPLIPKTTQKNIDVTVVSALYQDNVLKKIEIESQNTVFTRDDNARVEVQLNTEGLDDGECILRTFVFDGSNFKSITPVGGDASWHQFYITRDKDIIYENTVSELIGDFPVSDLVAIGHEDSPFDFYNDTHETVHNAYDELMINNPEYISKTLLGYDSITGQLPIYSYTFKPVVKPVHNESFPVVTLGGLIHGHENTAVYTMYHFFQRICNEWEEDEVLEYLRHNIHFSVIPIQSPLEFDNKTYLDSNGVNTNRVFSIGWEESTDTTKGLVPFSRGEAKIIADFIEEHQPVFHVDAHDRAGRQLVPDDRLMWFIMPAENFRPVMLSIGDKLSARWDKKYDALRDLDDELTSYARIERTSLGGGRLISYVTSVLGIPSFTWEGFTRANGVTPEVEDSNNKAIVDMNMEWYGETVVELIKNLIINK